MLVAVAHVFTPGAAEFERTSALVKTSDGVAFEMNLDSSDWKGCT
jgi:hypothetical protein